MTSYLIENLLITLLRLSSLWWVSATEWSGKELFKDVDEIEVTTPAELQCKRKGNRITIVDLCEGKCIDRILNMATDNARERIQCKHRTLTGTTAGYDEVSSATVQQLWLIRNLLQGSINHPVLCSL